MEPADFDRLRQLALTMEPTRWLLLRRAASRPIFRAEDARDIAEEGPRFKGSARTARYHATWLKNAGLLRETTDEGRLAYHLSDAGWRFYRLASALLADESQPVQSRTEPQVLAVLATLNPDEYEGFLCPGTEKLDVAASLRHRLETVAAKRVTLRVERREG